MRDEELLRQVDQSAMKGADGRPLLHLTIAATFYYFRDDIAASRRNVVACFWDYLNLAGDYLDFYAMHGKGKHIFDENAAQSIMDAYDETPHGRAMQFYTYGAENKLDASALSVQALDAPDWQIELGKKHGRERGISYISFRFPLCYFAFTGKSFIDFLDRCAERLKPFYGFAGIGPGVPFDHTEIAKLSPTLFMLAWAMPEFEIEQQPTSVFAHEGLRPVSWFTALGLEEIEGLGGLAKLREQLPEAEGFHVHAHDAGVTIRAGQEPLPGRRLFGTKEEFLAGHLKAPQAPGDILASAQDALGRDAVAGLQRLASGDMLDIPKAPREVYPLLYTLAEVLRPLRAEDPYQLQQEFYGLPYFDKARTLQYYERFGP